MKPFDMDLNLNDMPPEDLATRAPSPPPTAQPAIKSPSQLSIASYRERKEQEAAMRAATAAPSPTTPIQNQHAADSSPQSILYLLQDQGPSSSAHGVISDQGMFSFLPKGLDQTFAFSTSHLPSFVSSSSASTSQSFPATTSISTEPTESREPIRVAGAPSHVEQVEKAAAAPEESRSAEDESHGVEQSIVTHHQQQQQEIAAVSPSSPPLPLAAASTSQPTDQPAEVAAPAERKDEPRAGADEEGPSADATGPTVQPEAASATGNAPAEQQLPEPSEIAQQTSTEPSSQSSSQSQSQTSSSTSSPSLPPWRGGGAQGA